GPLRESLAREAADSRIEFLGSVTEDELHDLYGRAAALVLPSHADGMPTVILEAFASGTPAVATEVGAVSTMVDETTGVLVAPGEPAAFRAALDRLLSLDEAGLGALGAAARRRVEERFAWPAVARRTLDLLEQVVAER